MPHVVDITCPGCGARVQISQKECEYCHAPVIVSSMSDVFNMSAMNIGKYQKSYENELQENPANAEINNSLALCYLKMGFYDRALEKFDAAIEQNLNNSETYIYAAVCILAGRKPFLTSRPDIDKIEKYINAALMIEKKGLYCYFQAYIVKFNGRDSGKFALLLKEDEWRYNHRREDLLSLIKKLFRFAKFSGRC